MRKSTVMLYITYVKFSSVMHYSSHRENISVRTLDHIDSSEIPYKESSNILGVKKHVTPFVKNVENFRTKFVCSHG